MNKPSTELFKYWLQHGQTNSKTGKWMMFYSKHEIDLKWQKLVFLFEQKQLKGVLSMKVSTQRQLKENNKDCYVVFLYCHNQSEALTKEIGQNILDKTKYFCYDYGSCIYYKDFKNNDKNYTYKLKTTIPNKKPLNKESLLRIKAINDLEDLSAIKEPKYVILDIETNGIGSFRPPLQRPIEIAYRILNKEFKLLYKSISFVKGIKRIDWGDKMKCPYSVKEVNQKGKLLEIIVEKLNRILSKNTYIIGHNIEFDLGCINHHSHIKLKECQTFDTMYRSLNICRLENKVKNDNEENSKTISKEDNTKIENNKKDNIKLPKLLETANYFGIKYTQNKLHTAYYDILITEKCFIAILKYLKEYVSIFEHKGYHQYIKIGSLKYVKMVKAKRINGVVNKVTDDDILKYNEHDLDLYKKGKLKVKTS